MRGTKLNTEPTAFAPLRRDGDKTLCHEALPQRNRYYTAARKGPEGENRAGKEHWPSGDPGLHPKEACDDGKRDRRAAGLKFAQQKPVQVHPMKEYRRVPLTQLRRRLQVEAYEKETPFEEVKYAPASVRIKMRQHAGEAAAPVVREGQKVKTGEVVGRVPEGKLGADVHASIDGKVKRVTSEWVEIGS